MKKYFLLLVGMVFFIVQFPLNIISQVNVELGVIKGVMIGSESDEILSGAAIILCRNTSNGECEIQAELITTTDERGRFNFPSVPPGRYVLLYDPLGKAITTWKTINGLIVDYKLGTPRSLGSQITKAFFDTFGGGDEVIVRKGTVASMSDGKIASIDGSFTSKKYGFTIDFRKGKPLIIEVNQGETVEIEISAWDYNHISNTNTFGEFNKVSRMEGHRITRLPKSESWATMGINETNEMKKFGNIVRCQEILNFKGGER